jgi:hypothetical protein
MKVEKGCTEEKNQHLRNPKRVSGTQEANEVVVMVGMRQGGLL